MDLGITALRERLEQTHPRYAKFILYLQALTFSVLCFGIIVGAVVATYAWVAGTLGEFGWGNFAWTVVRGVFGVFAVALLFSLFISVLETKRKLNRIRQLEAKVEGNLNRVEIQRARVVDVLTRVEAQQAIIQSQRAEVESQRASLEDGLNRVEAQQAYVTERTIQLKDMANGLFEQASAFNQRKRQAEQTTEPVTKSGLSDNE